MPDPLTSTRFTPNLPPPSSEPFADATGGPLREQPDLWAYQVERGLPPVTPTEVTGRRLVSGTGEVLGRILGVQNDRDGRPKWIAFLEDEAHATPRLVHLRYVREVQGDAVRLAGPREGYHITRVMMD